MRSLRGGLDPRDMLRPSMAMVPVVAQSPMTLGSSYPGYGVPISVPYPAHMGGMYYPQGGRGYGGMPSSMFMGRGGMSGYPMMGGIGIPGYPGAPMDAYDVLDLLRAYGLI